MRYSSLLSVLALFVVGTSLAVNLRANYRSNSIRSEQQQTPNAQTVGMFSDDNYGRLNVAGDARVLFNGQPVRDGATVFPGGHLETPAGAKARVTFGQANNVVLGEKSATSVNFTTRSIDLVLDEGAATVSTNSATSGVIRDSKGNEIRTIPTAGAVIVPGNVNQTVENSDNRKKAGEIVVLGASSIPAWASLGTSAVYTTILASKSIDSKGEFVDSRPAPASPAAP